MACAVHVHVHVPLILKTLAGILLLQILKAYIRPYNKDSWPSSAICNPSVGAHNAFEDGTEIDEHEEETALSIG